MTAGTMTGTETGIETETGIGEIGIVYQEEEKMTENASDMTGVEVILTLLMTIGEPAGPFLHDVQIAIALDLHGAEDHSLPRAGLGHLPPAGGIYTMIVILRAEGHVPEHQNEEDAITPESP